MCARTSVASFWPCEVQAVLHARHSLPLASVHCLPNAQHSMQDTVRQRAGLVGSLQVGAEPARGVTVT